MNNFIHWPHCLLWLATQSVPFHTEVGRYHLLTLSSIDKRMRFAILEFSTHNIDVPSIIMRYLSKLDNNVNCLSSSVMDTIFVNHFAATLCVDCGYSGKHYKYVSSKWQELCPEEQLVLSKTEGQVCVCFFFFLSFFIMSHCLATVLRVMFCFSRERFLPRFLSCRYRCNLISIFTFNYFVCFIKCYS